MKGRFLVLFLTLITLTSGCITVHVETKIEKDGSGIRSFVLALDQSVVSMLEGAAQEAGLAMNDVWGAVRTDAQSIEGAQVEDYSDDAARGIKVTFPFASLQELQAFSSGDGVKGTDAVAVSQDGGVKTLRATVNVGEVADALTEVGAQNLEGFEFGEIDLQFTYAIEVEGRILKSAPQDLAVVEGNRVTWDLSQIDADAVVLTIQWDSGDKSGKLIFLLAVAVFAAVALMASAVILTKRRKSKPARTRIE